MQPFHNLLSHPGRPRERQYVEDDDLQASQSMQLPHAAARRLPYPLLYPGNLADTARLPPMAASRHQQVNNDATTARWHHAPPPMVPPTSAAHLARHYDYHNQAHMYPQKPTHEALQPRAGTTSSFPRHDTAARGFGAHSDGRGAMTSDSGHRPLSSGSGSTATRRDTPMSKVKRAKSQQKITRNRKITSCLQCRERKQKCDRQRPICGNCMAGSAHGGLCTYVDTAEGVQEVLASEGEKDAKRLKRSPSTESPDHLSKSIQPGVGDPPQQQSSLAARRINLIAATIKAGRDNTLEFDTRVRYARAAAIGTVLFGHPPPSDGSKAIYSPLAAVDSLKLPTSAEVGPLLDTYRREIEWNCNVVIIDLNRLRFESFLDWWHSNPQTLPADPPLIPLVLCVLALASQARRLQKHCTLSKRPDSSSLNEDESRARILESNREDDEGNRRNDKMRFERGPSPRNDFVSNVSSEKELLETAGRCIDALQIICPSNWASAFSAPLDLVRANLLRGLWHMSELHLQFAGSCFATTMRLAHAAALNHDTSHWPNMGKEEAQARRNIFWNCALFERMHTNRVLQPSMILPTSFDTEFPENYDALMHLYKLGGLIEPYIVAGRRSHIRVQPMSRDSFEFYTACYKLTNLHIQGQVGSRGQNKQLLSEGFEAWRRSLPENMQKTTDGIKGPYATMPSSSTDQIGGNDVAMTNDERRTRYLQDAFLQMLSLGSTIQIHRPQVDESGRWSPPEGHAQRSLQVCLESAQRLIWLIHSVVTQNPGPPFIFFNHAIFFCFQAAIVIAIQSVLSPANKDENDAAPSFASQARPSLDKAIYTLDLVASENGLRWVAEQAGRYAATLRDIDATSASAQNSRRATAVPGATEADTSIASESQISMPSQNMQRPAMGQQPLAIAEGDGTRMGGQGYPKGDQQGASVLQVAAGKSAPPRKRSSILPPEHLSLMSKDGVPVQMPLHEASTDINGTLRNIFLYDVPQSFGIDFDDLGALGTSQAGADSRPPPGYFADRPIPNVLMNAPPSTGASMDLQTASVPGYSENVENAFSTHRLGAATATEPSWQNTFDAHSNMATSMSSTASGETEAMRAGNVKAGTLPMMTTSGGQWPQQAHSNGALDHARSSVKDDSSRPAESSDKMANEVDAPLSGSVGINGPPSSSITEQSHLSASMQSASQMAFASHPSVQHAAAPNVDTLGETFAMDWNEWERAVERLLYSDRSSQAA